MKARGHTAHKHLSGWWRGLENASLSVSWHTILGLLRATSVTEAKVPWTEASPPMSHQSLRLSLSSLSSLLFSPVPPFLSCLDLHYFSSGQLDQSPNWWLWYEACVFQGYFHFCKRDLFKVPNSQCLKTCYDSSSLKAEVVTSVGIRITWIAC